MEININNDITIDDIKKYIDTSVKNKYDRLYINNLKGPLLNDAVSVINKKGYTISKNLFIDDNYIIELKK